MAHYYFLRSILPPISLDADPEITQEGLEELLLMNCTKNDLKKLYFIKFYYDLHNLKAFWLNLPFPEQGNYTQAELEEMILARDDFPQFILDFLDKYETTKDRIQFYPELLAQFFHWALENFSGFLYHYFAFERELHLTICALRAKKIARDLSLELQFEDPSDPFVAFLLSQKDAESIEPEDEYHELKDIFHTNYETPLQLEKALILWKLKKISTMEEFYLFEIDEILGYYIRLVLVEKWHTLDIEKNQNTVDQENNYA